MLASAAPTVVPSGRSHSSAPSLWPRMSTMATEECFAGEGTGRWFATNAIASSAAWRATPLSPYVARNIATLCCVQNYVALGRMGRRLQGIELAGATYFGRVEVSTSASGAAAGGSGRASRFGAPMRSSTHRLSSVPASRYMSVESGDSCWRAAARWSRWQHQSKYVALTAGRSESPRSLQVAFSTQAAGCPSRYRTHTQHSSPRNIGRDCNRPMPSRRKIKAVVRSRAHRRSQLGDCSSTVLGDGHGGVRGKQQTSARRRKAPRERTSELRGYPAVAGARVHAEAEVPIHTGIGPSRAGRAHAQLGNDRIVGLVLLSFLSRSQAEVAEPTSASRNCLPPRPSSRWR